MAGILKSTVNEITDRVLDLDMEPKLESCGGQARTGLKTE